MYHIDLKHDGLRKFRRLSGADKYVLDQRSRILAEAWAERWRRRLTRDQQGDETLRHLSDFEAQKAHAAWLTEEAQRAADEWGSILSKGLEAAPFKMEMLHDSRIFPERRPVTPVDQEVPSEPNKADPSFNAVEEFDVMGEFWALLLPRVRRKREEAAHLKREAAQSRYDTAYRSWQDAKHEIARLNVKARAMFEVALDEWWARAQAYQKQQQAENVKIEKFRLGYAQAKPDPVIEFLDAALSRSEYPDVFPTRWEMDFVAETGALVIDYELPSPEDFPLLKAVKYDVMNDTFEQSYWSAAEIAQFYERAIYQTWLRTLHDVISADEAEVVTSITFNGWANFTDKLHGRPARACIISVQAANAKIKQANFWTADPKSLFKSLKGVAGANLADMSAVVPLAFLRRVDDRSASANVVMLRDGAGRQSTPGSKDQA
jgi:restriction system protein